MAATIYVNGRITGEREAVIAVLDHGFLYGEGVYEVMRTYRRKPFLYAAHIDRMRRSAGMITCRPTRTTNARRSREPGVFYRDRATGRGDNIRVLTRGVGPMTYDPAACWSTLVIIVKPSHPPRSYEKGVKVILVPVVRNHPFSINPLIKSNNLLNNALAAQFAMRHGGFEAIMRNYRSEISECSQSNLFVVKDGGKTPPMRPGCCRHHPGVRRGMRRQLGGRRGAASRRRRVQMTRCSLPAPRGNRSSG
jgi:branched-chain amino acid aminotransferase